VELLVGIVFRGLQTFMGRHWRPLRVCFSHDAPTDRTEHDRLFRCRVEFGHAFSGIVCSRRDLDIANPTADPGFARPARQMLDAIRSRGPIAHAQVRQLVVSLLGGGACRVEIVAQHLGVDRRTIHRRLRKKATFSQIVASVRRELATAFLDDPNRNLAEVSLSWFSSLSGSRAGIVSTGNRLRRNGRRVAEPPPTGDAGRVAGVEPTTSRFAKAGVFGMRQRRAPEPRGARPGPG
jgi:hypothetical protein